MSDISGLVLIVEPDAAVRQHHQLLLARAGFRVVSAPDGTAAIRLAGRLVPDVVVTELTLPTLDGFHLARRLRRHARTHSVGIVAFTEYGGDDMLRRAAESGIDAVVRKPASAEELLRILRGVARYRRALVERQGEVRPETMEETSREETETAAPQIDGTAEQYAEEAPGGEAAGQAQASERMLDEAAGARDVMIVDAERGEALYAALMARYANHPMLLYSRGEAYRALGRRKQAYQDFAKAAEHLPDGPWRNRARFAARRTRSHHETTVKGGPGELGEPYKRRARDRFDRAPPTGSRSRDAPAIRHPAVFPIPDP